MSFENPLFLLALGAVAVPILIHLIYRLRKRVVTFGSLRFLSSAVRRNRRRLRLRDILLLALRSAVVALLALGFARPRAEFPAGLAASDVVFVLDDTFSMSASPAARTLFEEAKSRVLSAISSLGPLDRAGLVTVSSGGGPASPLSSDLDAVRARVRAAPQSWARAELAPALRAALGLLAGSEAPAKKVAIASDLQRNSWSSGALAGLPTQGVDFEVLLESTGPPNVAVLGVEQVGGEAWSVGEPVRVRARVANFGGSGAPGVAVRLRVGKEPAPRASVTIDVPAGGEAQAELAYLATSPGEFPATVEAAGRDALPADDIRRFVVRLRDRARVLCIQDDLLEGKSRYLDASYFVRIALSPAPANGEGPLSPFAVELVESRSVDAISLRRGDAFFLLGPEALSDSALEALAGFVREGRGALLAPAPDSREPWRLPGRLERLGLAPARAVREVEPGPAYPDGMGLSAWDGAHPVWRALAGAAPGAAPPPPRLRVRRFLELEPLGGASVLATFENGRPAVVAREAGRERVLQLAFSLRPESADLPKRRAFVPFVHGAAAWLARSLEREMPAAVETGTVLPLPEFLAEGGTPGRPGRTSDGPDLRASPGPPEGGTPRPERVEVVDPDGGTLRVGGGLPVVAERPGFYTLRVSRGGRVATHLLAANPPAAESDLRAGSREEFLAALQGPRAAEGVGGTSGAARAPAGSERGRKSGFWGVLVALAGGMMLVESLLANRVFLGVRSGAAGPETRS